jgi:hypothetical protein
VYQKALCLVVVLFLFGMVRATAQQSQPGETKPLPAAFESDIECSGFFSANSIAQDVVLAGGADNDFFDVLHQFVPGDDVYLQTYKGTGPRVGAEFRLVRPASEFFLKAWARPGLGHLYDFGATKRYPGQGRAWREMGQPYRDVGSARVIQSSPKGVVAEVTDACGAVNSGDIAIPYQPRPIPTYLPRAMDRFGTSHGIVGVVGALPDNRSVVGQGEIAYITLGRENNVQPGQRFRIIHQFRSANVLLSAADFPPETVGELVVLWTQEKSSVGIVIFAYRGIAAGDLVQGE